MIGGDNRDQSRSMFRSKHRSTPTINKELGMIYATSANIATDNNESTPLRQHATISHNTLRGNPLPSRPTPSIRRGAHNSFTSNISSSRAAWLRSGVFVKALLVVLLVSWSTFVLSFRFVRTTPLPAKSLSAQTSKTQLRGNQQTILSASTIGVSKDGGLSQDGIDNKHSPMKLSLWLIPSGGETKTEEETNGVDENNTKSSNGVYERTQTVIDTLSAELGGPKFMPHVTLGGATVASMEEALALAEKLRTGLSGHGPIDCFVGDEVLSGNTWNQALVFELVPPFDDFEGLCSASRKLLGSEATKYDKGDCLSFPPPLKVPHMSLYYGDTPPRPSSAYLSAVFGSKNEKKTFQADRVMLWKTDPSSLEGVSEWEPIADISLL